MILLAPAHTGSRSVVRPTALPTPDSTCRPVGSPGPLVVHTGRGLPAGPRVPGSVGDRRGD